MHRALFLLLFLAQVIPAADPAPLVRLGSDRFRQAERVEAIAYSTDGKRLATADADTFYLWDAGDGRRLHAVPVPGRVVVLGFSADGPVLALAQDGPREGTRLLRLDPAAGRVVDDRPAVDGPGDGAFTPDGRWLVVRDGAGREVRVLDPATGKPAWTAADPQPVSALAVRADGKVVAVARSAGTIRLYELATGKVLHEHAGSRAALRNLAFSPDGRTLIGESSHPWPKHLVRLDAQTGAVRWTHPADHADDSFLTPDGKSVVYFGKLAGPNPHMWHWLNAATGRPLHRRLDTGPGRAAVRPDGRVLAVGGSDGLISQWDLESGRRLVGASADPPGPVTGLRFTPDGEKLIGQSRDRYEWDVRTGRQSRIDSGQETGPSERVVMSSDGRWVVRSQLPGRARLPAFALVEPATGRRHVFLQESAADRADFLADGRLLIHRPDCLSVYDPDTRTRVAHMGTDGRPGAVAASANGTTAVRVSPAGDRLRVIRWDLKTGEVAGEWIGRLPNPIPMSPSLQWGAQLSPDGRVLAVIFRNLPGGGGRIRQHTALIDARAGRYLSGWWGASTRAGLAFSPDGRAVACVHPPGAEMEVREVWTGEVRVRRSDAPVHEVTFGPDGRTLALATQPGPIALWDLVGKPGKWDAVAPADLWAALEGDDAERAFTAICHLRHHPTEAATFLKGQMKVPTAPTADWVAARINDLDAAQFRDREKATADLAALGDRVRPELQAALKTASAEARRRLEGLLERAAPPDPETWRAVRACEALEGIGTREARDLLAVWAKGPPAATLTREASESVERLAKRR